MNQYKKPEMRIVYFGSAEIAADAVTMSNVYAAENLNDHMRSYTKTMNFQKLIQYKTTETLLSEKP